MSDFNLGNFFNKFVNYSMQNLKGNPTPTNSAGASTSSSAGANFQHTQEALAQSMLHKNITKSTIINSFNPTTLANLKMNNIASLERSLYMKDLMKLPKEMQDILVLIQNNTTATKEVAKLMTTNINMAQLAEVIQKGGKEAMNKLILVMADASKQGITDLSQIKDAIKFINASVSVAGQDNTNQILKTFMLLYLPWLPLQEGVDFELDIETSSGEEKESETTLTIMISTRNYGNIRVTLILLTPSSIDIFVNCTDKFPKEELLKRINTESKNHSIQTTTMFEEKIIKRDDETPRQAKINFSNLNEVNPFLLLMANAVIKHTIDLDNQV